MMSLRTLQMIRLNFCFLPCLTLMSLALWLMPTTNLIYMMTQYGNHFVIISSLLSFYLGLHPEYKGSLIKVTTVMMQMSMGLGVIITIVYWTVLHKLILVKLAEAEVTAFKKDMVYLLMVGIHFFPLIAVTINMALSKVNFRT